MIYLADEVGTRNHLALLDMTPNTETYNETSHVNQAHDQALQNGGSFTDSNNRWKIQITGKGGSGADAYVDVQVTDLLSPQITSQPVADQNATAGGSVTFNITASGSSLTYQWQKQDANGTWINISGATAASLTLSNLTTGNAGKYRVAITNNYGTVYSGESVLSINSVSGPIIHTQPTNITVQKDANATFDVNATGAYPLTYQWYRNGVAIPDGNRSIGKFLIPVVSDEPTMITTIAGGGAPNYSGDGGPAISAQIGYGHGGLAMDQNGTLYFAENGHQVIRKIDENGIITTIAGDGTNEHSGDGGLAINAKIGRPSDLFIRGKQLFFHSATSSNGGDNRTYLRKIDL